MFSSALHSFSTTSISIVSTILLLLRVADLDRRYQFNGYLKQYIVTFISTEELVMIINIVRLLLFWHGRTSTVGVLHSHNSLRGSHLRSDWVRVYWSRPCHCYCRSMSISSISLARSVFLELDN